MAEEHTNKAHSDALAMLESFASVGATRFDVTLTTRSGTKDWFRRAVELSELRRKLPGMLDATASTERNVIVRPLGQGVSFIQLDDLKDHQLPPLAPAVFLALETSPGNFQAWVALEAVPDKEFGRRLRKGAGADPTASGATRVAGSRNFKDKYAPDFPLVKIHAAQPARLTTTHELDQLGLVAAPEVTAPGGGPSPARARPGRGSRKWPSYERCLEGAPPSQGSPGESRHSIADFTWCLIAADWGWEIEEIARRLLEESTKARDNGPSYAIKTATRAAEAAARNAAEAAERRRQQPTRLRTSEYGRR
jgi:RepB DNA-primase from phage plasmid